MPLLLKNKKNSTKFQILVEVASGQPNIRQRDIAKKLDITPQAVSEYIKEMVKEETIFSPQKGRYHITKEGIEYITRNVNELKNYATFIMDDVLRIIDVSTAIADGEIKKGDLVGLYLKKGILYAHSGAKSSNRGAIGESVYDALDGEDVGVKDIKGFIEMEERAVKVIKIPNIKDGGSRRVNYPKAKKILMGVDFISVLGLEAYAVLKKLNLKLDSFFGAVEAARDAAKHGMSSAILCPDDEVEGILNVLKRMGSRYTLESVIDEQ
jgi:putative transcriptional regulator